MPTLKLSPEELIVSPREGTRAESGYCLSYSLNSDFSLFKFKINDAYDDYSFSIDVEVPPGLTEDFR